jgi:hypothetical protein
VVCSTLGSSGRAISTRMRKLSPATKGNSGGIYSPF